MRKGVKRVLIVAAALLGVAPAQAADLPAGPAIPPPAVLPVAQTAPSHFECYAGVLGEAVISHPSFDNVPVAGAYAEDFAKGGRGGVMLGCDRVFPVTRTTLGIDFTSLYGQVRGSTIYAGGFTETIPYESALRIRLGYMLDDQFSIFIAGGASASYTTTKDGFGVSDSKFNWGGQTGVGFEYRLWPGAAWRLHAEYAYTWPGSDSVGMTGIPLARMNATEHLVRLGILWRPF